MIAAYGAHVHGGIDDDRRASRVLLLVDQETHRVSIYHANLIILYLGISLRLCMWNNKITGTLIVRRPLPQPVLFFSRSNLRLLWRWLVIPRIASIWSEKYKKWNSNEVESSQIVHNSMSNMIENFFAGFIMAIVTFLICVPNGFVSNRNIHFRWLAWHYSHRHSVWEKVQNTISILILLFQTGLAYISIFLITITFVEHFSNKAYNELVEVDKSGEVGCKFTQKCTFL